MIVMAAHLGAHEVMEIHEVLTDTIDGINQFQLYRPHVRDQQLLTILDNQLHYMVQEYNKMVTTINQAGRQDAVPYHAPHKTAAPLYGLNNPSSQVPNVNINDMTDRDVASGMLGCHKSTATLRMHACLECADPRLRRMIQQGSFNSSEMAYELWQYMNHKGYYQVPTMKEVTTNTVTHSYIPANTNQMEITQWAPAPVQDYRI
jgi:spore coat protein CotF